MKWVVFNSIQVTNYWFSTLRTETLISTSTNLSPNIWGISDQDVTLWTLLHIRMTTSAQKSASTSQVNLQGLQQTINVLKVPQCIHRREGSCEPSWSSSSYILNSIRRSSGPRWTKVCLLYCTLRCSIRLSWPQTAWVPWQDTEEMNEQ
jgi:hypothetical protein